MKPALFSNSEVLQVLFEMEKFEQGQSPVQCLHRRVREASFNLKQSNHTWPERVLLIHELSLVVEKLSNFAKLSASQSQSYSYQARRALKGQL
ncbi:hypothetical protein [Bdellovibrio sp. HCB337]|uniref:hypothetical protein n=1 Tax=Bdellovibrio sp. HCB337 TaxID=3394358 RepID=UPI0039A4CE04